MKQKQAFTLAEVLLTLAVIGIVAAITLPSLLVDTTEKAFDAQKRALHARLAQAIGMMSSLSGYGTYTEETKEGAGDGKDNAAETFLYEGLSKVYKINNICNSDNLDKCGIPSSITKMNGESMVFPKNLFELNEKLKFDGFNKEGEEIDKEYYYNSDIQTTNTKTAAFETVNGESVAVFYNPNCKNNVENGKGYGKYGDGENDKYNVIHMQSRMCVNFVYDLNGLKGPNKVGRDIGFITALYAKTPEVVAPIPADTDLSTQFAQQNANEACTAYSDDTRLPNKDEAASLFYNKNLVGNFNEDAMYWSSSVISQSLAYSQYFYNSARLKYPRNIAGYIRCIKK